MNRPTRNTSLLTITFAVVLVGATLAPERAEAYECITSGCAAWSPSAMPLSYHVNERGYSGIPLDEVRAVFRRAWDSWEEPCCSAFRIREAGLTSDVAEGRSSQHIMSFREDSWPAELGSVRTTIAVTTPAWRGGGGGATLISADMVFNGVGHTFRTDGRATDLESIAAHEGGHWLGLGHTPIRSATMYFAYDNGTGGRTLHEDDISGVCDLYPGDCGCSRDSDCTRPGEVCVDGACAVPPCTGDSDCASGLVCERGDCVIPPCESDSDCTSTEICDDGTCRPDFECPICMPCEIDADCGAGYSCVNDGSRGFCTRWCGSDGFCPGNSECFTVPGRGETYYLCFNEDAASSGICPGSFVCESDDGGAADPCDGVSCPSGQRCNSFSGACEPIGGGGGGACSVCDSCSSDADCGGGTCVAFQGTGNICVELCDDGVCPETTDCFGVRDASGGVANVCLNADAASAGVCPDDFTCGGDAPADPCDGVSCGAGETCNPSTGRCETTGGGGGGGDAGTGGGGGDGPDAGTGGGAGGCDYCAPCSADADCAGGQCIDLGSGPVCTATCDDDSDCGNGNAACFTIGDGAGGSLQICLNADAETTGICHATFSCQVGSADLCADVRCSRSQVCNPNTGRCENISGDGGGGGTSSAGDGTNRKSSTGCATVSTKPAPWAIGLAMVGALVALRRRRSTGRPA